MGGRGGQKIVAAQSAPDGLRNLKIQSREELVKDQQNAADKLIKALEEVGFTGIQTVTSKTSFGTSTYVLGESPLGDELKFRISDHHTGMARGQSEIHFTKDTDFKKLAQIITQPPSAPKPFSAFKGINVYRKIGAKALSAKWNKVKGRFAGLVFKKEKSFENLATFSTDSRKTNIIQFVIGSKDGRTKYRYEWTERTGAGVYGDAKPTNQYIKAL